MERVELRRTMRAAMIIQRWYRGWVQARLAATDDLYAFLRKEGLLEFEPALRCAFSSVAPAAVVYRLAELCVVSAERSLWTCRL